MGDVADAPTTERPAGPADAFVPMLVMIAVMWVVEVVDVPLDGRLDRFGIRPRQVDGLDGIVLAPFLHLGFGHLDRQHDPVRRDGRGDLPRAGPSASSR